jgi:hypothetical protein
MDNQTAQELIEIPSGTAWSPLGSSNNLMKPTLHASAPFLASLPRGLSKRYVAGTAT